MDINEEERLKGIYPLITPRKNRRVRKGAICAEEKALHAFRRAGAQKLRAEHDNGRLPKRHRDPRDFGENRGVRGRVH